MSTQHFFVQDVIRSEDEPRRLQRLHEENARTRWFNIRHRNSQPILYVYDRFGPLCDSTAGDGADVASTFPTIVSFIGKSGVGKSTLVRAMLLLGSLNGQLVQADDISVLASNQSRMTAFRNISSSQGPLPVTRSGHVDHLADPTTFGVHLYRDEKASRGPLSSQAGYTLFADCEGFFTGATQTNAERLTSGRGSAPLGDDALEANLLYKAPVTASISTQDGQGQAELYYARFLYSISDVVVFVTNEDQNITSLLVSALEWAATAVLHSVNYPSRKTLIIVRNGAIGQRQQIIDAESLERLYLDQKTVILWKKPGILQTFVNDYNSRQEQYSKHIYDNRDLYDVLFDKTLCFCIPRVDDIEEYRDETTFAQYLGLRTLIDEASSRSISMRSQVWMKYEVASFSHMLFAAFEHFRTSDKPFNFNQVVRISKPNPQTFLNHIANFLRLALNAPSSRRFKGMIPDIIALDLVVWSMRTLHQGKRPFRARFLHCLTSASSDGSGTHFRFRLSRG
jgi:energy-coupling factor transporter ATP-binding protein EcfA2